MSDIQPEITFTPVNETTEEELKIESNNELEAEYETYSLEDISIKSNKEEDKIQDSAERAVSGKLPSFRPPRRGYTEQQIRERERKIELEKKEFETINDNSKPSFKREERKPEILPEIKGLILKEEIEIILEQEAIITLLYRAINDRYKREGLRVNPELDEAIEFKINSKEIKAIVKMNRLKVMIEE